jgi:ribonuclease VapC
MIVDTSALIAVLLAEADADTLLAAMIDAAAPKVSSGTLLEAAIVADRVSPPLGARRFDRLVADLRLEVVPHTEQQAAVARAAYRDFGKGSGHPAQLNVGDCFAYALAATTGEPLLFKGNDFRHTDVLVAPVSS